MNNIEVKKLTKEEFEDFILMKKIEDTSLEEITELLLNQGYLVMFWQQVYEQQKEEIERLNNRVRELEKAVSRKEEEITDLRDEIIDLESKIDESIEYIEKNSYTTFETIDDINYFIVRLDKCPDLLDILKGVDKE